MLEHARQGDGRACEELLARHRPELCAFVEMRFDARLRARLDASDVVQEAQVEALRRLPDYLKRRPMPFRHWLRKTAYERLLMLRRRHVGAARRTVAREEALPDRSSLALAQQLLAQGSTPSQRLAQEELARRVRDALAQLSESDRDLLLMRNYEGLAYEEVANIMGIGPAAARKRHGRALIRLHRLLADAAGEECRS
ncbi:MAG: sigma-70 family RNA polymerase sigma factor [Gemmataceae bacterium]